RLSRLAVDQDAGAAARATAEFHDNLTRGRPSPWRWRLRRDPRQRLCAPRCRRLRRARRLARRCRTRSGRWVELDYLAGVDEGAVAEPVPPREITIIPAITPGDGEERLTCAHDVSIRCVVTTRRSSTGSKEKHRQEQGQSISRKHSGTGSAAATTDRKRA